MKKQPTTAIYDADEVPPLPADFGRRAIVRKGFLPISCGPDAPPEFKQAVARAQRTRVIIRNRPARRA